MHIDAVGGFAPQTVQHIFFAVIDRRVKPKLLSQPLAFVVRSRDADHPASLNFGDLPHQRADRSRRRRHHNCVARFCFADFDQAHIGGRPRHGEGAERIGQRNAGKGCEG